MVPVAEGQGIEREQQEVEYLRNAGFIVDHYPDREHCWFVGLGSHGDSAPTLRKAVKKCLRCCSIGMWWRLDHGEGRLAAKVAREIFGAEVYG